MGWHRHDVGLRLRWRITLLDGLASVRSRHGWLGIHLVRGIRWRGRQGSRQRKWPCPELIYHHEIHCVRSWSIYPAGYFFGYLIFNHSDDAALNLIYNLADFVNKISFCLAIWQCAKADTAMKSK